MLKAGLKVRIIDAKKIACNDGYFKDGDVTEIIPYKYKGTLALKHSSKDLDGGLVISPSEERFVEVVR